MSDQEHAAGGGHEEPHATNRTYIGVAAVLAVLTALEVMVFYVPALKPVLIPTLLVLMLAKFALVVLFFMHLKYDSRILAGLFAGPLVVSTAVALAVIAVFGAFQAIAAGG